MTSETYYGPIAEPVLAGYPENVRAAAYDALRLFLSHSPDHSNEVQQAALLAIVAAITKASQD